MAEAKWALRNDFLAKFEARNKSEVQNSNLQDKGYPRKHDMTVWLFGFRKRRLGVSHILRNILVTSMPRYGLNE